MRAYTKLHDRRIPKVRVGVAVGVGLMEFQLNSSPFIRPLCSSTHSRIFFFYFDGFPYIIAPAFSISAFSTPAV